MMIHLIVGLIKKILFYRMSYFPEPYDRRKSKVKAEIDLSTYTTNSGLKNATGVDISDFAKNTDLASLKITVD